jgi:predicted ATPase
MLIKSLSLKDFKCFEQVDIDFGKITLLTGANSSGKSSLIYALLGIMQSKYFPQYFALNGELINMGGFDEVLRKKAEKREFEIEIKIEHNSYKTHWEINNDTEQPELKNIVVEDKKYTHYSISDIQNNKGVFTDFWKQDVLDSHKEDINEILELYDIIDGKEEGIMTLVYKELVDLDKTLDERDAYIPFYYANETPLSFNYLGSFRLPPERTYYRKPKAGKVGVNGEGYIDQIIEWEESDKNKYDELIKAITEMGLFKSIQANKMKGGRFELNVQVNENSELASLTDVGFGISQFLPIIVADLQMDKNSCLAISQPEIHLHPKIQASLGDYLCKKVKEQTSITYVNNQEEIWHKQYIVETHSEYLINRMRLLIVKGELKPEDVKLYYMENDGIKTTTYAIELTTDGQIKNAPQGFFDTYEMDVMDIALYASA